MNLLTEHLAIWTGADNEKKSGRGRASGNAASVYGVKKLRELILELAVRGKLVPQEASDEPASELLKRIAAEKARLVKGGKIKAQKPLAEIGDDEKPFELPKGWEWVRLNELLSKIGAGSTPLGGREVYLTEGIPFLRSQNVWDEGLRLSDVVFIAQETHQKMSGTHVCAGDLLFNITGASIGRCAIVPDDFETGNVSQHVTIVRSASKEILFFLHLVLISRHVQQTVMDVQVGVSREGLSIGKLGQFLIPIPPLAEQNRIVAKVDELMTLCDQLENQHSNAIVAHEKLVSYLLNTLTQSQDAAEFNESWQRIAANFDTLFSTESSIDALKQTVLQLAVMGKLVPQDVNDEPASELLKRIQAEKAKLVKERKYQKTAKLKTKESTQLIPSSWEYVQVGHLCPSIVPNRDKPRTFTGNIPWITLPSFPKDDWYLDTKGSALGLSADEVETYAARVIPSNSVLMSCVGRFGLTAINAEPVVVNQQIHAFVVPSGLSLKFLSIVIRVNSQYFDEVATSTTIKYLNKTNCESMEFGLPPQAEQHRIVAKVDELMAICDQLKTRITTANQLQQKLADVLVAQAVA